MRTARDLPPAAFSIVMATGIASTAAQLLGWQTLSWVLFFLNLVLFPTIAALLLVRLLHFPERVRSDFHAHGRSAGFLTVVAATAIVGTHFVIRVDAPGAAMAIWDLAVVLWIGLIYAFFAVMTVMPEKLPLEEGMNASWMLLVVATQSVSVLGTLIAPDLGEQAGTMLAFTTGMFLLGCMFYMLLFSLILYRILFFPFEVAEMGPPYWINMGAVAITTLAGSLLILHAPSEAMVAELVPFIRGFTLLFWSTATWWFPLLLILGVWRHGAHHVKFEYDLGYWSMVFPLGMYAVATHRLIQAFGWHFLGPLPVVVGSVALLAWVVTFVGWSRAVRDAR